MKRVRKVVVNSIINRMFYHIGYMNFYFAYRSLRIDRPICDIVVDTNVLYRNLTVFNLFMEWISVQDDGNTDTPTQRSNSMCENRTHTSNLASSCVSTCLQTALILEKKTTTLFLHGILSHWELDNGKSHRLFFFFSSPHSKHSHVNCKPKDSIDL